MMKLLSLSFLFFLFFSACGESESSSLAGEEDGKPPADDQTAIVADTKKQETAPPSAEKPVEQTTDLCSKTCVSNAECGKKYNHCLRPKAGSPALTETISCTHSDPAGNPPKILVLNEWNSPAGQNKLLCDFIENEKYLYRFATVQKQICRADMENRKHALTNAGYQCEASAVGPSEQAPSRPPVRQPN